jgi:hypothetical protein
MNVQNLIAKGIKEQLFRHEFLVLPDFGGFILKKSSANFSGSNEMLFPPAKTIGFNVQLKQNDGILQQWLSAELKCSAAESAAHLKEFSEYCKAILSTKGRFNLDGIGFFYTDLESNISFEPLKDNFLRSSFGLEAIPVKELEVLVQETIRSTENTTDFTDRILTHLETEQKENTRRFKTYHKVAYASLGVIALLSILFFVVSNTKFSGKIRAAMFHSETKRTYAPIVYSELKLTEATAKKKDYVADANGVAAVELEPNKIVAVQALAVATKVEHRTPIRTHIRGNFELVVGCFAIESNAKKLVRQLKAKGIEAFISGKNEKGLHVVSGGGFNTKEDALAQLNILKSACCPKVWVRKVN